MWCGFIELGLSMDYLPVSHSPLCATRAPPLACPAAYLTPLGDDAVGRRPRAENVSDTARTTKPAGNHAVTSPPPSVWKRTSPA